MKESYVTCWMLNHYFFLSLTLPISPPALMLTSMQALFQNSSDWPILMARKLTINDLNIISNLIQHYQIHAAFISK